MPLDPKQPITEDTFSERIEHHLQEDDDENDFGDFYFIPDWNEAVDWGD